jgi:hypothetical protein
MKILPDGACACATGGQTRDKLNHLTELYSRGKENAGIRTRYLSEANSRANTARFHATQLNFNHHHHTGQE